MVFIADDPTSDLTPRIAIHGAREHNLKNISLEIPRGKFVVVTGVSGSGKSTLAFDLLFAEGQRRFLDSMNTYARQFVEQLARPEVDLITGLPPTVSIEQRTTRGGGKSTVATVTEIYHFIRLLFARLGEGCATGTRGFAPATPPVNHGGLAGGYVAWKHAQQLEKMQAVIDRFDGIDDRQLFDLAAALPGSRLVAVEDVSAPELAAPTTWEKLSTGVHLVASLKFRDAEWGDKKFYLESRGQVGQAAEILQGTLHADLRGAALGAVV